jgi:hypothetical protein
MSRLHIDKFKLESKFLDIQGEKDLSIKRISMFIYFSILALGVFGFFIHLFTSHEPKTALRIVKLFLLYQLVFSVGLTSLLAFIGLMFMSDFVAAFSGWPPCPFDKQLANVNLGYAVLGILCIWKDDDFWLATILGSSIWLFGDGIGHLGDMLLHNNHTPGNVGVPLYTDLIIPVILMILYAIYQYLKKQELNKSIPDF